MAFLPAKAFAAPSVDMKNGPSNIYLTKVTDTATGEMIYDGSKSSPLKDITLDRAYYKISEDGIPLDPTWESRDGVNYGTNPDKGGAPFVWVLYPGDTATFTWDGLNDKNYDPDSHKWRAFESYSTNDILQGDTLKHTLTFSGEVYDPNKKTSTVDLTVKDTANIPPEGLMVEMYYYMDDTFPRHWSEPYYFLIMPKAIEAEIFMLYDTNLPSVLNTFGSPEKYGPDGHGKPYTSVTVNLKNLMRDPEFYAQYTYRIPNASGMKPAVYLSIDNMNPGVPTESRKLAASKGWQHIFNKHIPIDDQERIKAIFPGAAFGYVLKREQYTNPVWHLDGMFLKEPPNYMVEILSKDTHDVVASKVSSDVPITQDDFLPFLVNVIGSNNSVHQGLGGAYGHKHFVEQDSIITTYYVDAIDPQTGDVRTFECQALLIPDTTPFNAPGFTGDNKVNAADYFHINANPPTPGEFFGYYMYPGKTYVTRHILDTTSLPYTELPELTISKTVAGDLGNTEEEFTFTVHSDSSEVVNRKLPVRFSNDASGQSSLLAFDKNGDATLKLKHGVSAEISVLPGTYTVTELGAQQTVYSNTTVSVNGAADEKAESAQVVFSTELLNQTIAFTNTFNAAPHAGTLLDEGPFKSIFVFSLIALILSGAIAIRAYKKCRSVHYGEE